MLIGRACISTVTAIRGGREIDFAAIARGGIAVGPAGHTRCDVARAAPAGRIRAVGKRAYRAAHTAVSSVGT